MEPAVLAAWIAAGAAVIGTGISVRATARQTARQIEFEGDVHDAQHRFERQQVRFADRRDAYRAFLSPAEALIDLLTQYVRPGAINMYEAALELTRVVAQHVPDIEPGPVPANPLPELPPDSQEARALRELSTQMRTQRVMVTLVGSEDVAGAALKFERATRIATGAVLSRDAPAALEHFLTAVGAREEFITAATQVLNDEHRLDPGQV